MHEHIFIESIIKQVPDQKNVISIEIELGELVGIEINHLKKHLIKMTSWEIEINLNPSKIKCSCGYIGKANIVERLHDLVIFNCPDCNSYDPEVIEGDKIKIVKVIYRK
jgi:Zn finger protein HypA/HybF involved in hydrogenase expression